MQRKKSLPVRNRSSFRPARFHGIVILDQQIGLVTTLKPHAVSLGIDVGQDLEDTAGDTVLPPFEPPAIEHEAERSLAVECQKAVDSAVPKFNGLVQPDFGKDAALVEGEEEVALHRPEPRRVENLAGRGFEVIENHALKVEIGVADKNSNTGSLFRAPRDGKAFRQVLDALLLHNVFHFVLLTNSFAAFFAHSRNLWPGERHVKYNFICNVCEIHIVLDVDISVAQIYRHGMHPPPVYSIIGSRIRTRRRQMELTQERLSRQLGISRASLANIETGRQQILVHQIYNLAAQLELDITDLLPPADSINVSDAASDLPLPQGLKARDRQLAARAFREADTRELEEGTDDGEGTQSGSARATGARRSGPRQRAR